jgi:hypothetical protein
VGMFCDRFLVILTGKPIEHATAYGRIAYSVPKAEQPVIDQKIKETGHKILTPLITLDTPGKASVTVIILADPVCRCCLEGIWRLGSYPNPQENFLRVHVNRGLFC